MPVIDSPVYNEQGTKNIKISISPALKQTLVRTGGCVEFVCPVYNKAFKKSEQLSANMFYLEF